MFFASSAWLVPVVFLPVAWLFFTSVLSWLVEVFVGDRYTGRLESWVYASFVSCVALGYVVWSPYDFVVEFRPSLLVLFVVGATLYHVDRAVWRWWTQRSVERTPDTVDGMLPVLLVPPAEELLYRGVLGSLVELASVPEFVVVSAVSFGFLHFGAAREVSMKTVDGVVYAISFVYAGTVLAPILAHLGYNCATVLHCVTERSPMDFESVLR